MADSFPEYLKSIQAQITAASKSTDNGLQGIIDASKTYPTPGFSFQTTPVSNTTTTPTPSEKKDSLRFMLVSTHIQQYTGYSRVSQNIIKELNKNPEISLIHYGFQKHPQAPPNFRGYPSGVDVIDAAALEQPAGSQQGFGFSHLPDAIRKKKPHVVMIYNDMSVIMKFLEEIRKSGIPRTFKIWLYVDQVYNCQLQGFIDLINRDADRVFAFSPYWKKCLKDQGVNRPVDILLHGFDKQLYFPIPREMARKQMGLPNEAFLYMCLNRNQPRKRYDILIMAFVELIVKNPQKPIFLLCICDKGEKGGWWIFELFQRELKMRGVPVEMFANRLMLSSQDMTYRDEEINMFYNVADVGISTSDGEGWGLCNFEQMGVGVPQVVPEIGGFKEFCTKDNSVLVKPKLRYYLPMVSSPVGGEAEVCDPRDVCLGMEEYLFDSAKREAFGKAAREKVLTYTWDRAVEPLVKRLLETKKELKEEGDL
jgi:glycosyltransferase involved in cell wall biosynthesis